MFTRFAAAAFSILLLTACEEDASKNICKGLSETDCTAKSECYWNAEKAKCKPKGPPETGSEQAPPEQKTPPAASEQTPPEQSAPATPPGPSTTPETVPGNTPPQ
jgi:hypothetical protein